MRFKILLCLLLIWTIRYKIHINSITNYHKKYIKRVKTEISGWLEFTEETVHNSKNFDVKHIPVNAQYTDISNGNAQIAGISSDDIKTLYNRTIYKPICDKSVDLTKRYRNKEDFIKCNNTNSQVIYL